MVLIDKIKGLTTKTKIILLGVIIVLIAAIILCCYFFFGKGYYATTMRLLRVEGTVSIEDSTGKSKPVIDNILFHSGDALNTGGDGLASVGLDDTKIVTLKSDSRAEFVKKRKKLELKLTKGALFFEVTEKLRSDESFEIKTSTMTAGIRGTSGYLFYDVDGRESLVVTDGVVHVVAINPDTGEVRETDVSSGQKIKVYLYSDRPEGSIEFFLDNLEEDEIPVFSLKMLAENPDLLDKVCSYTGWDKQTILDLASGVIKPQADDPDKDPDVKNTPTPTSEPTKPPTPSPVPTVSVTPEPTVSGTPTPKVTPTKAPTPEPTPETTPEPSETPTPTPETTPEPSETPTPTPETTPEPSPSVTPEPSVSPEPSPSVTPEPSPSVSPEPSPSVTPEPEPSVSPEPSPSVTPEPEPSVSPEPSPSVTPEPEPSVSPEPSPSVTPEPEPSVSPEPSPSVSPEPEPSVSPEPSPSVSPEPEPSVSPEPSPSVSPEPSPTPDPVPNEDEIPEGYEMDVWDEENLVFIFVGISDDEEIMYIGYVDGDWISLSVTELETSDGMVEIFYYERDGDMIEYYRRTPG